eukprot:gb/GFBE01050443.1/.p1 GENE.gb/GFBE01050443.1/~~gb/GFBE01050443.1/.p1  ORF type:complete len:578 (+),score=64.99 gb/GFBE01050443.1/:1-1734(+)
MSLPAGFKTSGRGSLGDLDPRARGANKHGISEIRRSELSKVARSWLTDSTDITNKDLIESAGCSRKTRKRAAVLAGKDCDLGRMSENEFDEFIMRAGEPSPTVPDLVRWTFLFSKVEALLGKTSARNYLNALCRWRQDGNQVDAYCTSTMERIVRCMLLPTEGPIDARTVTCAKKLGMNASDLVAARKAAEAELAGMSAANLNGADAADMADTDKAVTHDLDRFVTTMSLVVGIPPGSPPEIEDSIQHSTEFGYQGALGKSQTFSCIRDAHCLRELIASLLFSDGPWRVASSYTTIGGLESYRANRHWAYCRPLFLSYANFERPESGPGHMYVFDIRYVFESSKGSKQFLRRSVSYLAEHLFHEECHADEVEMRVQGFVHPEISEAKTWGDESRVFGGPNDPVNRAMLTQVPSTTSLRTMVSYCVLMRVGNVVAKLFVMFEVDNDQEVPQEKLDAIYSLASHASERLKTWVSEYREQCRGLLDRLPPLARCQHAAYLAATRALASRAHAAATKAQPMVYMKRSLPTCAMCGQSNPDCKRCAGCLQSFLCSEKCQAEFWNSEHKASCSREFELKQVAQ